MPSTTIYKRGEVVLVPFPFTDLSALKQRPALVVSSDSFNQACADLIVVAITSQIPASLRHDEIALQPDALTACGLPKASIVKLSKIVTLHQRLIIKKIGAMPTSELSAILNRIRSQF